MTPDLNHCPCTSSPAVRSATEPFPVVVEIAAHLADPRGAEAVPGAHVLRPFTPHEVLGQAAVPIRTRHQPGGEVTTENDLIGRWGLRVVHQRLFQWVAAEGAEIGQALDDEMVLSLGRGCQRVP